MGVHVSVRQFRRPDQPQPVYPQVVDATVRTWMPAIAAELACVRTGARAALDVRGHDWSPEFTWVRPVVDAIVRTWLPAFDLNVESYRTPQRPLLDVRPYDWAPEFTWPRSVVDAIVAKWSPVFSSQLDDYTTRARAALDVRDWLAQSAWIFTNLPTASSTAQQWPALLQALGLSYRSLDGPRLDVRRLDVPLFSWSQPVVDGIVRTWTPSWTDGRTGDRTSARPVLDVRGHEWAPAFSWVNPVVDATVSAWGPIFQSERVQERSGERAKLDVRGHEWSAGPAWVSRVIDAVVATWPAIWAEQVSSGERTRDDVRLDVRLSEWAPAFTWPSRVVDAVIGSWSPAFQFERLQERTTDRGRLDVRAFDWSTPPAWIFVNLPSALTIAQIWPAILEALGLSYRSAEGPRLDLWRPDWSPEFGWANRVVDATLAGWSPVFQTERGQERSGDRAKLDGRGHETPEFGWAFKSADAVVGTWPGVWSAQASSLRTRERVGLDTRLVEWAPELAWIFQNLPGTITVAQQWPAILQALGLSYRSSDHAALDVRNVPSPVFGWPQRVVDAIVAKWAPIFDAEVGLWTPGRPSLDVRSITRDPEIGWFVFYLPPPTAGAPTSGRLVVIGMDVRYATVTADQRHVLIETDTRRFTVLS